MATGQPKTKANDLLVRLQRLGETSATDEVALVKIRHEAELLLSSDFGGASQVLGFVAALNHDVPTAQKFFVQAMRVRPNDSMLAANYSVVLVRFGLLQEAIDVIEHALLLAPGDLTVLDMAIRWHAMSGLLKRASDLCQIWTKLKPESPHGWRWAISKGLECLYRNDISEPEVLALVDHAIKVLRDSNAEIRSAEVLSMADEDSEWLSIHYVMLGPVESVVELNVRLAEKLATVEPPPKAEEFVTVMYLAGD